DKPAFVVLNAVPPRGTFYQEARQAVALHGLETAPVHFVQRNAFMNSLKDGLTAQEEEPRGKAAQEVAALFKWVCTRVGLEACSHKDIYTRVHEGMHTWLHVKSH
ncbi:MAG: ParA family protein, partial [Proteobacteria bacterium]|nr:ParA family protein [Pseudomonadota bacterium]